jgi:hypothetical protein
MKHIKLYEEFLNEANEEQKLLEAKVPSEFRLNFPNSNSASRKYNQSIVDWLDKNVNSLGNPQADKEFVDLVRSGLNNADVVTYGILDPSSFGEIMPDKLYTNALQRPLFDTVTKNTIIDSPTFGKITLHGFVVKMRALAKKNKEEAGRVYYDEIKNMIDSGYPPSAPELINGMLAHQGFTSSMERTTDELIDPEYRKLYPVLNKLWNTDKY